VSGSWEAVIGLEIHVQLRTTSEMSCSSCVNVALVVGGVVPVSLRGAS
jgi:Asp-tRNA(Asn)/Glu-tRNA(Gln) amidotransferase B subunit